MEFNKKKIIDCMFSKKYFPLFIILIIIYFFGTLYLNGILEIVYNAFIYNWFYQVIALTTLINAILFALVINLALYRYREIQQFDTKQTTFSGLVVFFSFIIGGCPTCAVGFLPLILAFFGIGSGFLLSETFFVILQVITILLFLVAIYFLQKTLVCGIKRPKGF
ncbi:MAG: hypothetical protein VX028_01825 [Nanoarchaeota archaeon]|nr:hypothetical protein [Nanoarchaeota archaeon]